MRVPAALVPLALLLAALPGTLDAGPFDVNACNYSDLLAVPGLGPRLADALLDEQSARGDFGSPADLARVPGIGPVTAVRIGAHLSFPSKEPPRQPLRPPPPPQLDPPPGPVDLNSASEAELVALPGVGKVLAARLIEFRRKHGRLRGPGDLARIKGLGGRRGEKLAGLAVFR